MKKIRDELYHKNIADDPWSFYAKNNIKIRSYNMAKMKSEKTEYGAKPYQEWKSYKNMTLEP